MLELCVWWCSTDAVDTKSTSSKTQGNTKALSLSSKPLSFQGENGEKYPLCFSPAVRISLSTNEDKVGRYPKSL